MNIIFGDGGRTLNNLNHSNEIINYENKFIMSGGGKSVTNPIHLLSESVTNPMHILDDSKSVTNPMHILDDSKSVTNPMHILDKSKSEFGSSVSKLGKAAAGLSGAVAAGALAAGALAAESTVSTGGTGGTGATVATGATVGTLSTTSIIGVIFGILATILKILFFVIFFFIAATVGFLCYILNKTLIAIHKILKPLDSISIFKPITKKIKIPNNLKDLILSEIKF